MKTSGKHVSTLWRLTAIAAAIACVFHAGQASANGTDPTVVEGQVSFSTSGSSLSITNSPGAIINWQGFSIGADESTRFIQQSATSSVLNRVIGSDPSLILGTLTSNGRVFLINPSGILVGQGARIDVAGLVASTLNLSNQDFLAGRINFASNPHAGKVENQGSITTPSGGSVYLVGANVTNSGIINSPQGDVILAAGQSVKIFDSSTPGVRVELTASDNAAVNLGEILAQSGEAGIYGAVLRNTGVINADQVVRDASGKIVLRAKQVITLEAGSHLSANGEQAGAITVQSEGGTTLVSGTIEAKGTGAGQTGGTVQVLGDKVGLFGGHINASGDAGGGTVLIGGDYQGKNPSVQNASATYVSSDASVKADAVTSGNGGKVIVWADGSTRAYGSFTARGGAQFGDGGLIETSAHWLDVAGININASAPHGNGGTWLLDPANVTITGAVDSGGTFSGGDPDVFTPASGADTANVNLTTITTALNLGTDVTINTVNSGTSGSGAGDINVDAVITWSVIAPATPSTLTLNAVQDVNVNAGITATRGSLVANAGRNVNVAAAITTTDGDVVLRADSDGTGPGVAGGTVNITGGVTMTRGAASIYYNPTSYAEPTDYSSKFTLTNSTLNSYMWVFAQGDNKVYDGLTTASLSFVGDPTIGGDVTLTPGTANFDTKHAGTGKTVIYSGYTLGGTNANEFALFSGAGTTTANITQAALTLSTTNVTKTYNGNLTAAGTAAVAGGTLFSGDTLSGGTFAYTDKDVGSGNKTVTISAVTVNDGNSGGNYSVSYANNTTSTITAKDVTIAGTVANDKIYDGNTLATLSNIGAVATGVGTETLVLNGPLAADINFNDKDVLDANLVTGTGYSIADGTGLASNYALTSTTATAAANITSATLTVTADAVGKVYGAIDPVLTYTTGAFQFGDTAGSVLSGALSRPAGENVGSYAINQNTLASNANYTIAYTGNSLTITQATLNVAANHQSKLFGQSDPVLTFSVTGLVNNSALGITDTTATVLSGALTRVPGESALGGPYAITQGSLVANSNYTIGFTPNNLIITGAAAEPVLGFNAGQVIFAGVINNEFYYRPGNFWHISLNPNNADPGFDVMRGTSDLKSRLGDRLNRCDSVSGGGFCETWSFPEQREKAKKI